MLRWALVGVLVAGAIGWRLVRQELGLPANLELVTVTSFAAMTLLGRRAAWVVPIVIVMLSDLALGNTAILAFTWTAWAVVGIGALAVRRPATGRRRYAGAIAFGAGASIWFYLWTNFGVWLLGRGTWYPAGWDGLLASYVAGLPFLRPMLLGNLVLLPLAVAGVAAVERWEARRTISFFPQVKVG